MQFLPVPENAVIHVKYLATELLSVNALMDNGSFQHFTKQWLIVMNKEDLI